VCLSRIAVRGLLALTYALAATCARAEYVNLKNGQQFHVTSYQLLGDKYRLQLGAGFVEVAVEDVASIEPEDRFAAIPLPPAPPAQVAPYREFVKAAAARYAVDEELINSVIAAESNFDPKAISRKNARGLMQLLPETAARYGVQDIFDPKQNIDAGTHYLSELLKQYNNDLALALAAYNAGPVRVTQFGRVPPYNETISYVRRVKASFEKGKAGQPALPILKGSAKQKSPAGSENSTKAATSADAQPGLPN
jgi:soluble lytic murein transglycosylase-like protein